MASQRPLPLPETQSTRYPTSNASAAMSTIPNTGRYGARPPSPLTGAAPRPPPLTLSSLPAPFSSNTNATNTMPTAPRTSVLTPSGAVSDGFPPSGPHSGSSHSSHAGAPPLYFAGHMTGSWPTPGLSQPSAYTYATPNSGPSSSGPLAQPPFSRGTLSYGSTSSPSHQHFPGRSASSTANGDGLPAPQSYQDQQGFGGSVGVGGSGSGAGGGLGSPLGAHAGSQPSGLAQPLLGNTSPTAARHHSVSGQSTSGGPATAQDAGAAYRQPPTPTSYYPQTSAPQSNPPFPSYNSPVTQPSPTTASTITSSGAIPRGSTSIPAMAPSLQYPGGARTHGVPSMASYASYSPIPGPVLSNMHHPGAPLSMVGGMPGLPSYNHHHTGLSPHHPHHLYVHHPGGPSPQSERPFKCNECTQAFNRNHDLKRHQRIHLAIKPFGCDDCEKRFSRKDALKVRTHSLRIPPPLFESCLLTAVFSAIDSSRDAAAAAPAATAAVARPPMAVGAPAAVTTTTP